MDMNCVFWYSGAGSAARIAGVQLDCAGNWITFTSLLWNRDQEQANS